MPDTRRMARVRACAKLEYPFEPPAADGSLVEIAHDILWLRMPMPLLLDHINIYLLRDGSGWTVVDTGLNTAATRALWGEVLASRLGGLPVNRPRLGGLPVNRLICTHFHYDHTGLAAWWIEQHGVSLMMSHGEYFQMRAFADPPPSPLPATDLLFFQRAGMTPVQTETMFQAIRDDPFMPPLPPSYERVREGDRLRIGARDWQVLIGEGHSPEHVCLYDAKDAILIAGDQLLPRITSNVLVTPIEPEANPLKLWLASLDRLERLAPETLVLPSHQGVFRGLHPRVQEIRAHHHQQFQVLCERLATSGPATAYELMRVQFPKLRHAADELMAMGETLAHLSWLRQEGRVRRVLDGDGFHRFSLAT